jgi:hypothetical protein
MPLSLLCSDWQRNQGARLSNHGARWFTDEDGTISAAGGA